MISTGTKPVVGTNIGFAPQAPGSDDLPASSDSPGSPEEQLGQEANFIGLTDEAAAKELRGVTPPSEPTAPNDPASAEEQGNDDAGTPVREFSPIHIDNPPNPNDPPQPPAPAVDDDASAPASAEEQGNEDAGTPVREFSPIHIVNPPNPNDPSQPVERPSAEIDSDLGLEREDPTDRRMLKDELDLNEDDDDDDDDDDGDDHAPAPAPAPANRPITSVQAEERQDSQLLSNEDPGLERELEDLQPNLGFFKHLKHFRKPYTPRRRQVGGSLRNHRIY